MSQKPPSLSAPDFAGMLKAYLAWHYEITEISLNEGVDFTSFPLLHQKVNRTFDTTIIPLLHAAPPACKKGCSWCCCIKVMCLPSEIIAIALKLMGDPNYPGIKKQVDAHAQQIKLKGESIWDLKPICPFLKHNQCSIYHFRPLACRQHFSRDATLCEKDYKTHYSKNTPHIQIPFLFPPKMIASTAMAGVAHAMEQHGLDAGTVEFYGALSIAFNTPNLVERFVNGEKLFKGTYYTIAAAEISNETDIEVKKLEKMMRGK